MNRRSLTFRLVAWYCALLLVIGATFAAFTYIGFSYYLKDTMRATLLTRAKDVLTLASPVLGNSAALADAMENRFSPEAHDRFMRIIVDGSTVYRSGQPISQGFDVSTIDAGLANGPLLESRGPLWIYGTGSQMVHGRSMAIETGESDNGIQDARRGLVHTLLFALPLLLIIAAIGGYWLVRDALTPVGVIINAAEELTFNSPHKRLPLAGTHDVFDDFVKTLNRMLDRLDHAYQHANRFSADAAHELRTPLAIMRGELEYIAARRELPPETAMAATSALDEAVRMSELLENLMTLSVIDGTGGKRAHKEVELRELCMETIDQMRLLAVDKGISIVCRAETPVFVLGDWDRLKQALVNLIDNAIKYTLADGRITVEILEHGETARLIVADTGIGIAPEHRATVFERFFRVSPDRGPGGAGLGLAIIKSICVAHSGSIAVESHPNQGSSFIVDLPLAPIPVRPS